MSERSCFGRYMEQGDFVCLYCKDLSLCSKKFELNFPSSFDTIDKIVVRSLNRLRLLRISYYYINRRWIRTLGKFGLSTFIMYYAIKAPVIIFFTEYLNMWYIDAGFLAGVILSVISWVISERWIWRK